MAIPAGRLPRTRLVVTLLALSIITAASMKVKKNAGHILSSCFLPS
jgi:hypothetical protein